MLREEAIQKCADALFNSAIEHHRKSNPERLAKLEQENPERLIEFREEKLKEAAGYADDIMCQGRLYKRLKFGMLHPSNSRFRTLFTDLTGIELPPTSGGTFEVVSQYLGDFYTAKVKEEEEERERLEQEKVEKERLAKTKELERIKAAVVADTGISGDELVYLARAVGVEVHPRTVGMLRKRVVEIKEGAARIYGKGDTGLAHRVYMLAKQLIHPNHETS